MAKLAPEQIDDWRWRLPREGGMRVDGLIFADAALIEAIREGRGPRAGANVAHLPGIVGASLAMPDIHWGYGFPIGGVAATDPDGAASSRRAASATTSTAASACCARTCTRERGRAAAAASWSTQLFRDVPTGVGAARRDLQVRPRRTCAGVLRARRALGRRARAAASERDLEYTEAGGRLDGADPRAVSDRAVERGAEQCGTLGSGNHFLEVQVVDRIYDERRPRAFGLREGQVTVHDPLRLARAGLPGVRRLPRAILDARRAKYGIELPDRQLACAPVRSPEGQRYLGAMRAAANFALRQPPAA